MRASNADALVLTDMSEISWLLNIKGYDLPLIHVLKAYLVIELRSIKLFVDEKKITDKLKIEWDLGNCGNEKCME